MSEPRRSLRPGAGVNAGESSRRALGNLLLERLGENHGLVADRRTDALITAGGVPPGSDLDFVSGYLTRIFNFVGVDDVIHVAAQE